MHPPGDYDVIEYGEFLFNIVILILVIKFKPIIGSGSESKRSYLDCPGYQFSIHIGIIVQIKRSEYQFPNERN